MPVTRAVALHPGLAVSIVLKADQPTGILTTGRIADVLTRGDHPRGIKVRLQDGQIGRVQSLASNTVDSGVMDGAAFGTPTAQSIGSSSFTAQGLSESSVPVVKHSYGRGGRRSGIQDDYRLDPQPAEERTLEDYITFKAPRKKGRRGVAVAADASSDAPKGENSSGAPASSDPEFGQRVLQGEFPGVDSALIAAILGDHQDIEEARNVLKNIS